MNNDAVLMDKDENIAILTLNRPEALNSFNVEIRDQLYHYVHIINDDPTIDAVVVQGAGRGFCAGADLKEFGTAHTVIQKKRIRLQHDLWEDIRRMPKPIAAAMHGFAVGSGLEMAMLFDFRFASPGTKLSLPEARIGMLPAAGGTQSLPRLAKQGHALDLAISGRTITAEEGVRMGIINRIIDKDQLLQETMSYMKGLVGRSPQTASWIKSLVSTSMDMPEADGVAREMILVERSWKQSKEA